MSIPYHKVPLYSRFNQKQNDQQIINSEYKYGTQSQSNYPNYSQQPSPHQSPYPSYDLKQSTSTTHPSYSHLKSNQDLYLLKLQSKGLEMIKKIQHQKYQIYLLTQQTQNLTKLCDEQKSYLKGINVDMMKQEYDEEIIILQKERQYAVNVFNKIKQERKGLEIEENQKVKLIRYENQMLTDKIQNALKHKQVFLLQLKQKEQIKKDYQFKINQQNQRIDQLRHIQRKVAISLKQLDQLRKKSFQLQ